MVPFTMVPRWYQTEATDKTLAFIAKEPSLHPLIVCPTGSGKSLIISLITRKLIDAGSRVLIVTHVEEIITQDAEALTNLLGPDLVGIYSSGLKLTQRKRVTVAGIQSIHRKASLFSAYDYIIVDEAHTIPQKQGGMYHRLFDELSESTVIGLTATPFRMGTGYLTDGEQRLFDKIIYDVPIERLIKEGYLCPLLTQATENELDTAGIKTVAGDYSQKDMSAKLGKAEITERVLAELIHYKEKYKSWLLFAIDIKHAVQICDMLNNLGIHSSVIHSKQTTDLWGNTRPETIDLFKEGKFQALVSVATLTTGFDHPGIDLIALIRPTKSPVLHVQMIGRGLRISPQKQHCLILDFAGNIMRLGPINDVHVAVKGKKKGKKEAPVKICPGCLTHVGASARTCYICGHEFPLPTSNLTLNSSKLEAIVDKAKSGVGWFPVSDIVYGVYKSRANIISMRTSYTVGGKKVHEYINPITETKRGRQHLKWWRERVGDIADVNYTPASIQSMVRVADKLLKKPVMIQVDYTDSYPKIVDYSFN